MTNADRYHSAEMKDIAFGMFCNSRSCDQCSIANWTNDEKNHDCRTAWLGLEVNEEKPLPCPSCGNDRLSRGDANEYSRVVCECGYHGPFRRSFAEAVAAYNDIVMSKMISR